MKLKLISFRYLLLYGQIVARTIFAFCNGKFLRRCVRISNKNQLQINENIRDKVVRLIGSDGSLLGIVSSIQALNLAAEQGLDLVKIADKANPPVCKIMDYGKHLFETAKKAKESKKNQHTADLKEIRLSVNIDTHDLETKAGHAKRFAESGSKIKVAIRFKGREMGHPEIGSEVMKKFAQTCAEFADIERPAKLDGRNMLMFLAPKNKAIPNKSKNSER